MSARLRLLDTRHMNLPRRLQRIGLLSICLALSFAGTGCRSFLRKHAMKSYPVQVKPADMLTASNAYQTDFLYLKTLADEVVPLRDRYFPPDKRAALEQEILRQLGEKFKAVLVSIVSYVTAIIARWRVTVPSSSVHANSNVPDRLART